ncbi:L-threonylcarbamoyladenylate synthase [Minwuia thermotolerans]|uniref:Threonylcarbamoyl-AMP synthase n=1 Tax=Minwuia thermotolerans TaxID=2056226 RepID=A0A2M9G145_9PROT|nr:L-threonylcarbamoyladenylate synthase [Minwuia thermotolerans]PJK29432.1 threonylcarbamoyl-AMP synthase [Minwuia thermotolerans]
MAAMLLEPTPENLETCARALREGRLVAFPTETVYGLGADATDDRAVAAIFEAKGRPSFNPLIVHVPDLAAAEALVEFGDLARRLAQAFWPGALTLVLPRRPDCPVSLLCSAGLETLAVRVPAHGLARALLRAASVPVAAPSANPSGRLSPTEARHVAEGLGEKVAYILNGGPCAVGLESTVVGVFDGRAVLLRPGGVAAEEIEEVAGPLALPESDPAAPRSPGMLASHYAPKRPIRLNAAEARDGEILLGFGADAPPGPNLSPSGDLGEAAANLFRMLHELDGDDGRTLAVMPVPETGLGRAINDRLRRAAADRDG